MLLWIVLHRRRGWNWVNLRVLPCCKHWTSTWMRSQAARAATSCQSSHPHCSIVSLVLFVSELPWRVFRFLYSNYLIWRMGRLADGLLVLLGENSAVCARPVQTWDWLQFLNSEASHQVILNGRWSFLVRVLTLYSLRWPRGVQLKQLTEQLIYTSASWQIEICNLSKQKQPEGPPQYVSILHCNYTPSQITMTKNFFYWLLKPSKYDICT